MPILQDYYYETKKMILVLPKKDTSYFEQFKDNNYTVNIVDYGDSLKKYSAIAGRISPLKPHQIKMMKIPIQKLEFQHYPMYLQCL
ncbi:MAG: hypothetical protein Q4B52_05050 [Tissierellia bacterium]|nr:hypothetical protein [Tissierellia bacterium]